MAKNKSFTHKKVYLPMTADLIHVGHLNAIRHCLKQGELYIGLLTDTAIKEYRGARPIIPYKQRKEMLSSLIYKFTLVPQDSIDPYKNLVKYGIDVVASGDGFEKSESDSAKKAGCSLFNFPYCNKQSTTKIKDTIIC